MVNTSALHTTWSNLNWLSYSATTLLIIIIKNMNARYHLVAKSVVCRMVLYIIWYVLYILYSIWFIYAIWFLGASKKYILLKDCERLSFTAGRKCIQVGIAPLSWDFPRILAPKKSFYYYYY